MGVSLGKLFDLGVLAMVAEDRADSAQSMLCVDE